MQSRENTNLEQTKGKKPQKRVLALCDFACASGFAQVAQNIVAQVLQDPDIDYYFDIVAINFYGLPNEWSPLFPRVRLFPAGLVSGGDLFGRQGFVNMLGSGAYDIAWVLQDTFIVETIAQKVIEVRNLLAEKGKKTFKFIYYFPIDAPPKENWIQKSVSLADIPVAYTKYGYDHSIKFDEKLKDKLVVIPHGVDNEIFFSAPQNEIDDFRKLYFENMAEDRFIITNLNRNQPRKDIARTLQIFSLVKRQIPEALLYLHMKNNDVAYHIDEAARVYELIPDKDYIVPANFDENQGMPLELVNMIYNSSNLVMTTTFGEGWGLSITEAMAAGTPVIAPNNTALTEILADDRGTLIEAGKTVNDWILLPGDNERLRPIVSVTDYVENIVKIRNNYKEYKDKAKVAQKYLLENWTWSVVGKQWREVFKKAIPAEKKEVVGRNDPCTCGSGKKYKACHGR